MSSTAVSIASTNQLPALQWNLGLNQLLETNRGYLRRTLRLLGVPSFDLDDALQEVFLVVFQRLHEYKDQSRARSWLYAICFRVAGTKRRKRARYAERLLEDPEFPVHATQLDRVVIEEALALGQQLLQRLRPEQRDVFWLYEVEGRSMPEVARMVSCPLQTAYSRWHRAKRRIQQEVNSIRQ